MPLQNEIGVIGLKHKVKGAFTIETTLSLTFFMLSILALMMVSMLIRIQADMQYAINQTAKEISGYFYLADRIGLASALSAHENAVQASQLEKMDTTIGHMVDLAGNTNETYQDLKGQFSDSLSLQDINDFKELVKDAENNKEKIAEIGEKAKQVGKDLKQIAKSENKMEMLKAFLQVFGKSLANKAFSKYVTPMVCEALLPKYLTSGDVDDYYRNSGIDPESVNFGLSEILQDGRSVKLVVVYEVDVSKLTFGIIRTKLKFRQVGATAAWIIPNDVHSESKKTGGKMSLKSVGDDLDPDALVLSKPSDKQAKTSGQGAEKDKSAN